MVRTNAIKRKVIIAYITIVIAALILLSGTLAWQSYNQEALNEVLSTVNPGGRLHDDFVDITFGIDQTPAHETMTFSKDVYVENFTSYASNGVQIYARVRLDEYMELGANAGLLDENNQKAANNEAEPVVPGASLTDKTTWKTHIPDDPDDPFHKYWNWNLGGQTYYMPTFNKNNNSVKADINGTFRNNFKDYEDYAGISASPDDDVNEKTYSATYYDAAKEETYTVTETHTVNQTIDGSVITMQQWLEEKNQAPGNYWVYDTDGWAYWANPIDPETATGLLLNGISRTTEIINEDWYYGINVVAQFITGDDIGYDDGSGFYHEESGSVPTDNALLLLSSIGVEVPIKVSDEDGLHAALDCGGRIVLENNISVTRNLVVTKKTTFDMNGYRISNESPISGADNKTGSLITVKGSGITLTINGGTIHANGCNTVEVRDGAKVIINSGTIAGYNSAVYVYEGHAVINGGEFSITEPTESEGYNRMIAGDDGNVANGKANITICGGKFHNFDPSVLTPDGYSVSQSDNIYTVSPK